MSTKTPEVKTMMGRRDPARRVRKVGVVKS